MVAQEIDLEHVSTQEQLADLLTKPLGIIAFEHLRAKLDLVDTKENN